jgi:Domain of unknown function (DUF4124)
VVPGFLPVQTKDSVGSANCRKNLNQLRLENHQMTQQGMVRLSLRSLSHAAVCALASISSLADADQVFQCRDSVGKVTFSNVPCAGAPSSAKAEESAGYNTYLGEWRGQTQFKQTLAGQAAGTAHVVAPMTLMIDAGGKVTGASVEAGCRVLGVTVPGPVATVQSLDLTLSSCNENIFNRRYTGSFGLYTQQKYAEIFLVSPSMLTEKPGAYSITATLRR